ncbi:MAG: THUMP domain-containing protein [Flavobacteriales bacterium]|nr:THUMP domain-containing protein [Flavobacteriales bacterium]
MHNAEYILIKTHAGLEEVLENELAEWQIPVNEKGLRCVFIPYQKEYVYRCNMFLRTALRVLVPVHDFTAEDTDEIYVQALRIKWEEYFPVTQTFAIDFSGMSDTFTHLKFASLRLKDAICDRFRNKLGSRPDIDREYPDVLINLHVNGNKISLSIDTSGESLHIRNSRRVQNVAPLNEVLAAGLIRLTGWDKQSEFVDGMCGSGTFTMEALGIASHSAPCLFRSHYGFKNLPDFDKTLYENLMTEAEEKVTEIDFILRANDIFPPAVSKARRNIQALPQGDKVKFTTSDFTAMRPQTESGVILLNPPYGERIQTADIEGLYAQIGSTLKHNWPGFKCGLISSDIQALHAVGLRQKINRTVFNGALECKFRVYDLYAGSKRTPQDNENPQSSSTN